MKLELDIKNTENVGQLDIIQKQKIADIIEALITSGGLTGVKGGQTIIHFDDKGNFRGVQLSYWPWRKLK